MVTLTCANFYKQMYILCKSKSSSHGGCRFVMSGDGFISSVTAGSADVFRFDTAYGLTQEQVNNVNVVFLL